jgi:hypothetical protein
MHVIEKSAFLEWASMRGIECRTDGFPPHLFRYASGLHLSLELPQNYLARDFRLGQAFRLMEGDGQLHLWRSGGWNPGATKHPSSGAYPTRRAVAGLLRHLGVPEGERALRFNPDERELCFSLVLACASFADHAADDLFIFPANGEYLVWVDHDDLLIVQARDETVLRDVQARLGQR